MISRYLQWAQWKDMDKQEFLISLKSELSIPVGENDSLEKIRSVLAVYINDLIEKDFQKLVNLLYRLDVSENKLKQTLKENADMNAGLLIADLIMERQIQKLNAKKEFRKKDTEKDSSEERW